MPMVTDPSEAVGPDSARREEEQRRRRVKVVLELILSPPSLPPAPSVRTTRLLGRSGHGIGCFQQ